MTTDDTGGALSREQRQTSTLNVTESDDTLCDRVAPGSKLLDALLMLAEPGDRDGVELAHGSVYGFGPLSPPYSEYTEAADRSSRFTELKQVLTDKLISLLEQGGLVLQCWASLDADYYILSRDKVPIVKFDIMKSQIALPDSGPVNVRVHPAKLAPGVDQVDAARTGGVEGADEHSSQGANRKPGRPSRQQEIQAAWLRLLKKDAIDFLITHQTQLI